MSHKLTPKQKKATLYLAQGHTAIDIAGWLRLRRETISRWRNIPEFNQEIERCVMEARASVQQQYAILSDIAISAIRSELKSGKSDTKRIAAALNVLKAFKNNYLNNG